MKILRLCAIWAPRSADDFGTLAALIALCVPAYMLLVLA